MISRFSEMNIQQFSEEIKETLVKYLIIGNGVAGTEAALTLKKNLQGDEVTIVTEVSHRFYFRPRLIECLGGDVDYEKIYVYSDEYFSQKGITIHYSRKVLSIDRTARKVSLDDGSCLEYDRLLIASGAVPFVPPVRNSDIEGFFTLRTIDDAKKINEFCRKAKHVIIAGGGLLGLESAHTLLKMTDRVTVVENEPYLLPRQLDSEGGNYLEKKLRHAGLDFVFSDRVAALEGESSLRSVLLASGGGITGEALLVSTGIRSECSVAAQCGLAVNRGIVVDANMRTPDPCVFAAGDCAECGGRVYGLWLASKEQGRVAALNMSGGSAEFTEEASPIVLKIPGVDLFCAGDLHSAAESMLRNITDEHYVQLALSQGKVRGVAVIGDHALAAHARSLLQGRMSVEDFCVKSGL